MARSALLACDGFPGDKYFFLIPLATFTAGDKYFFLIPLATFKAGLSDGFLRGFPILFQCYMKPLKPIDENCQCKQYYPGST